MLGDNIRIVRTARKMSINKLSKLTGISLGYLSDLENNKAKNPTMDKINKIAEILCVPVGLLLGNESVIDDIANEYGKRLEAYDKPTLQNGKVRYVHREMTDIERKELAKEFLNENPDLFFDLPENTRNRILERERNAIKKPTTIAAHIPDGVELTEEDMKQINDFIQFIISKKQK